MRQRITAIDTEIEKIAEAQLSVVPGIGLKPADLGKSVAQSRERFAWFTDRPNRFSSDLDFGETDISALRQARIALGKRIEHINSVLPAISDLPDGAKLAQLHENLIRAEDFANLANQDRSLSIRLTSADSLHHAERALKALETLLTVRNLIEKWEWLQGLTELVLFGEREHAILITLTPFISDASKLLEEHTRYLQRPVDIPESFVHSAETVTIVT